MVVSKLNRLANLECIKDTLVQAGVFLRLAWFAHRSRQEVEGRVLVTVTD